MRKPFQGVLNIIRFNWQFYAIAFAAVFLILIIAQIFGDSIRIIIYIICGCVLGSTTLSLIASIYVYDLSDLYKLNWIEHLKSEKLIVNINAGFDETSALLNEKFCNTELIVLDFYDPLKHTEISIKRARKAYPAFPNTKLINTSQLELSDNSADKIFVILSAHEIRNEKERILFF